MKCISGYFGASKARFLSQNQTKPTWFVCANEADGLNFFRDLCFFLNRKKTADISAHYYPCHNADLSSSRIRQDKTTHERLQALTCHHKQPTHLVTTVQALGQISLCPSHFTTNSHTFAVGQSYSHTNILEHLCALGFEKMSACQSQGQFALKGDILDLFPVGQDQAYRLAFFGDELEEIRMFDPTTQQSQKSLKEPNLKDLTLGPAKECLYPHEIKPVLERLKAHADGLEIPTHERMRIQQAMSQRSDFAAISKFIPFLVPPKSLMDHWKDDRDIVWIDPFSGLQSLKALSQRIADAEVDNADKKILSAPTSSFFPGLGNVLNWLKKHTQLALTDVMVQSNMFDQQIEHAHIQSLEGLRDQMRLHQKSQTPLAPFLEHHRAWKKNGLKVHVALSSQQSITRFEKLVQNHGLTTTQKNHNTPSDIAIDRGEIHLGFVDRDIGEVWISEVDLFGTKKRYTETKIQKSQIDVKKLALGDPVVHVDFGVGLYKGLQKISVGNLTQDFLVISYAKQDKLLLPIHRLSRIHPFVGGDGAKPKIDTLGSQAWKGQKDKAQKAVEEIAQELIELYAQRNVSKGHVYPPQQEMYEQFERLFPFEETPDQIKTMQDIEEDLQSDKLMDRLVCGDVGFGKTEIALRTACRVVMSGKQAAVLVPTTILCQQHAQNFKKRFSDFPVVIDFVSRFKTTQENKATLEKLAEGKIDIIIGTHRLLSKDVTFANLGLLVLDEEQRFGVKHKEKIKTFKNKVDVLTLTATPIPRTLQLSITGIRDLSLINTPPLDRKSVETILAPFDEAVIRDAVFQEMQRKGQVFFLHNRVETISSMQVFLQKLLPDVRIRKGHGQMDKDQLEQTMVDFLDHQFDLLLCTTIIESGIDVPNANTLIVNRADRFGLAQLYQIRGRIGRSTKDACAYFLIPGEDLITPDALKRLKTLKRFTELGSGLHIAMHDLEMRGAGNLLGAKQSGHMSTVGFEMYMQLLQREIRKRKGEKVKQDIEPELQVSLPASIPETYIADHQERLLIYRRLSICPSDEQLDRLHTELVDRFGKLPNQVRNLLEIIELKIVCRDSGVKKLTLTNHQPTIEFSDQANLDMNVLLKMVQKEKTISLTPDHKLHITFDAQLDPYEETKKILKRLHLQG